LGQIGIAAFVQGSHDVNHRQPALTDGLGSAQDGESAAGTSAAS
jgi:hypothetical protein